jgi:hypothetical protein
VMTPSASSNHIRAIIGSPPWPSPEPQPGTRPGTGHHPCGRSAIIVSISPPGSRASRHPRCAHAPIRPAPLTRLSRPWRPTRGQRVGLQRLSGRILRHQAEEAPHSHLVTEPARFADLGKSGCPCPLRPGPGRRQRQAPTGSSPEEPPTNPVSYATLSYPTFPRPAHSQPPSVASGTRRGKQRGEIRSAPRETWIQRQQPFLLTARRPPGKSRWHRIGSFAA